MRNNVPMDQVVLFLITNQLSMNTTSQSMWIIYHAPKLNNSMIYMKPNRRHKKSYKPILS